MKWQWYQVEGMIPLWLHLLLNANHTDRWQNGILVKRGQVLTGRKQLAKELNFSEQTVRTCLNRLKSTNEITIESTNRFSLITLINWDKYQLSDGLTNQQINQQINQQVTSNQPATNQQVTTNNNVKNDKNLKKEKEKEIYKEKEREKSSFQKPTLEELDEYSKSIGFELDSQAFLDFYDSKGWMIGKNKMKDWKAAVRTWKRQDRGKTRGFANPRNNVVPLPKYITNNQTESVQKETFDHEALAELLANLEG